MNVFSLFSGIGGLELGLERAGMTVVGQVEINEYCRRVLARHWPEVPRHDDVRTCIDWWRSESRPVVDLVCGGFPCQPVSTAGRQLAQADPRWLWPAFHTVVRELRPRYVLVENVPGLFAHGMGDVLGDLAAIGYDAEWDRVPAAFVGAPHLRTRIFIVAYPQRQRVRQQPVTQPGRGDSALIVHDGEAGHVADVDSVDRASTESCRVFANSSTSGGIAGVDGRDRRGEHHWVVEPDVGRVAPRVPARLDRLRALGNAVVPQVAEHIGRLILTTDTAKAA